MIFALMLASLAACERNPERVVTTRYANGQIAEVRSYARGEKTGTHRGWWANGAPKFECRYDDGAAVGTCREWYANGRLAAIHRFQRGAEAGLQQGWSDTGRPQFSYVMRDGRRYGLLGALNCKPGVRTGGAL
jgi:antitoxin component YwqK of YwqJK toxin-antitoxin module